MGQKKFPNPHGRIEKSSFINNAGGVKILNFGAKPCLKTYG
jgi:hypothetical protein